jgi:hypothetical protein
MMTLKEWLKLNPNHRVTLAAGPDDTVRALLHKGEGIDQRLIGDGVDELVAIKHALENRERIREQLP